METISIKDAFALKSMVEKTDTHGELSDRLFEYFGITEEYLQAMQNIIKIQGDGQNGTY